MRHIYRNIILLMTVLCLLAGTAAAEEAPATPTDLEPTPQGLIEAEIQKADKTVRLEAKKGSRICVLAETDRQVEVHAAPADGSAEKNLKETRTEGEPAGYIYEIISYETRTDVTLIRICGKSPAPFTVLIQTEAAWRAAQQNPIDVLRSE